MTNQTRMRMSKDAAKLIHEYRDNNEHRTNTDAVYGMVCDLDVGAVRERCMQRDIDNLNAALSDANEKVKQGGTQLRLSFSANADLQEANLRKRERVASLEQPPLDQADRHDKQLENLKEKLKTRNEWLAIFAVSNVVGWGLAITALSGVM